MFIGLDAKNFFLMGWLCHLMGLPRTHPSHEALKPFDNEAFGEGWDMARETGREFACQAIPKSLLQGDITARWVRDDGTDV